MPTNETHNIIVLPYGNQVPSREEILKRLTKLYSEYKPLLPLLTACAEESERIMHERFVTKVNRQVTIKTGRYKSGAIKPYNYQCPSCFAEHLRTSHKFCHGCGRPIQWT